MKFVAGCVCMFLVCASCFLFWLAYENYMDFAANQDTTNGVMSLEEISERIFVPIIIPACFASGFSFLLVGSALFLALKRFKNKA